MTTGAPAALKQPPGAATAGGRLARLIGCERSVLGVSTLHLFFDLFTILSRDRIAIFVDEGIYPIARWMVERAAGRGAPVAFFQHGDSGDLQRLLGRKPRHGRRPVVVSDGFCPGCGRIAPIGEYLESIRRFGGLLVLDDTQAMGILGEKPTAASPWGFGGGGSLQWSGAEGSDIVIVNSLAKAYGVPVAVLAGERGLVRRFERESDTRVHCSPPSAAAISAAFHALEVNEKRGDRLRHRLQQLVARFRDRIEGEGFKATGALFPVQGLAPVPALDVYEVYERLREANVRVVLRRSHQGMGPQLALLITVDHSPSQINEAAAILASTMRSVSGRRKTFRGSKRCRSITSS